MALAPSTSPGTSEDGPVYKNKIIVALENFKVAQKVPLKNKF